ncbi:MAG TPA: hypothetical protein PKC73_07705 [Dermatophilaceae bacterium]|jgi:hypothetical protein|nr:hypothetical protein [Actinomycetales bacterium]HMT33141.1 hypothetical protein [Dermatophilaceae bacterium]HMT89505.1 hypothetical protein [Dermatophilaceae bacterium]
MSDLQCPARFLVVQGGLAEHADLAELLGALREERIAAVYAAADAAAASGAGRLASHLGMPVRPLPGSDRSAGTDGLREALEALADGHRGEAVLVVLGWRQGLTGASSTSALARIDVDSDGWRVLSEEP